MKALIVVGVVLAALLLLSLVRVGAVADYSAAGLVFQIRVGALRFTLFPMKPRKKKKADKPKKPPEPSKAPPPPEPRQGGGLELVKQFLPLLAEAAGRFKRKVRIDRLDIDLTVACPDPAMTAVAFGGANAALGMMVPLFENNFNVKERSVRTRVDFDRETPAVAVLAAMSLTIGQGVVLSVSLGVKALKILLAHRKKVQSTQKEAV